MSLLVDLVCQRRAEPAVHTITHPDLLSFYAKPFFFSSLLHRYTIFLLWFQSNFIWTGLNDLICIISLVLSTIFSSFKFNLPTIWSQGNKLSTCSEGSKSECYVVQAEVICAQQDVLGYPVRKIAFNVFQAPQTKNLRAMNSKKFLWIDQCHSQPTAQKTNSKQVAISSLRQP